MTLGYMDINQDNRWYYHVRPRDHTPDQRVVQIRGHVKEVPHHLLSHGIGVEMHWVYEGVSKPGQDQQRTQYLQNDVLRILMPFLRVLQPNSKTFNCHAI